MKEKEYCVRCNANDWKQVWAGWGVKYKCKKCGYIFDWIDYVTASKVQAGTITCDKIDLKSFIN